MKCYTIQEDEPLTAQGWFHSDVSREKTLQLLETDHRLSGIVPCGQRQTPQNALLIGQFDSR